jgi:hypothetical protein
VATLSQLTWPTGAAWEPFGQERVVFGSNIPEGDEFSGGAPPNKPVQIRIWDPAAAGTGEFVVVHAQRKGPLHSFAWSPDAQWIAYTTWNSRDDTPGDDLFLMKVDGGRALPLMKDAGYPAWHMAVVPQLPPGATHPTGDTLSSPTPGPSQ